MSGGVLLIEALLHMASAGWEFVFHDDQEVQRFSIGCLAVLAALLVAVVFYCVCHYS